MNFKIMIIFTFWLLIWHSWFVTQWYSIICKIGLNLLDMFKINIYKVEMGLYLKHFCLNFILTLSTPAALKAFCNIFQFVINSCSWFDANFTLVMLTQSSKYRNKKTWEQPFKMGSFHLKLFLNKRKIVIFLFICTDGNFVHVWHNRIKRTSF